MTNVNCYFVIMNLPELIGLIFGARSGTIIFIISPNATPDDKSAAESKNS
jgi:hypothetical protein